MENNLDNNFVVVPLIDAKNPPISVDSVIVGEAGTGAIRLSCFAGDGFVIKEENVQTDDKNIKKLWVRPVCVIDINSNVVKYLESYLLFRLSNNLEELKNVVKDFPDFADELNKALQNNGDNRNG